MSESIKSYKQELALELKNQQGIVRSMRQHVKGSAMWNYLDGQLDRSKDRVKFINQRIAVLEGRN